MEGAIEDEAAFFEHKECRVGVCMTFRERNHAAKLRIEAMGAEGESILQAVSDKD